MTSRSSRVEPTKRKPNGRPLIGISMGDPCGIGAEVIVKALDDAALRERGRFVIYGMERRLSESAERACIKPFWFKVSNEEPLKVDSGVVVVDYPQYAGLTVLEDSTRRPTKEAGKASLDFLDGAIAASLNGETHAVVTAPIHKVAWQLAGSRFPGHTEKLADACRIDRVTMMFSAGDLRVALASAHIGLFQLRNHFTLGRVFQPIELLHNALVRWFGRKHPVIAVAGLNPHAGEEGQFGDEETRVIEPAMQMARNIGIEVAGPFPADSLFTPRKLARFDGVVAMYHDQGLIPVKMQAFDEAVNITLGLPIIRTGVGHGTAFDIAGTNQANPGSMKAAIQSACSFADCEAHLTAEPHATSSVTSPTAPPLAEQCHPG